MIHLNGNISTISLIWKSALVLCGTALIVTGIWQLYSPFIHTTLACGAIGAVWGWTFTSMGMALITGATLWSLIECIKAKAKKNESAPLSQAKETRQRVGETVVTQLAMPPLLTLQNSTCSKNQVEQIPKEIWVEIFSKLDAESILNCQRVCKTFHYIINQTSLWGYLPECSFIKNFKVCELENSSCLKKVLAVSLKIDACLEKNKQILKTFGYSDLEDISYVYKTKKMLFIGKKEGDFFYIDIISLNAHKPNCITLCAGIRQYQNKGKITKIYFSNNILMCQCKGFDNLLIWKKNKNAFEFKKLDNYGPDYSFHSFYSFNNIVYIIQSKTHKIEALKFNENIDGYFFSRFDKSYKLINIYQYLPKMFFVPDNEHSTNGRLFIQSDLSIIIYELTAFGEQFLQSAPIELKHSKFITSFFYENGYLYCMACDWGNTSYVGSPEDLRSAAIMDVTVYAWEEQKDRNWSLKFTFDKKMSLEQTEMLIPFFENNLRLLC